MNLAFVVQRYGQAIAGGSEAHCRLIAERLAPRHDITVLTTCATDYVTWANTLPPGETTVHGVRVLRFPVSRPRALKRFADASDAAFARGATAAEQVRWFQENGPECPGLLDYLRTDGSSHDLVVFWTYRYALSYFGLPLVRDRAVLVPTAEEDGAIGLSVLGEFFSLPRACLYLTPEEEALVSTRAHSPPDIHSVIGMGLDPAHTGPSARATDLPPDLVPSSPYLLYLGRVDRNKGCHTLLEYFEQYSVTRPDLSLVLAGPAKMTVPAHPRIVSLGYVSDEHRDSLLSNALALVVPSPFESLSIVLLEAWNRGIPAIVNGGCTVLDGQVRRANGGLPYRSAREFGAAIDYLLEHPDERQMLGAQGLAYVEREYRWPTVLSRVESVFTAALRARLTGFS